MDPADPTDVEAVELETVEIPYTIMLEEMFKKLNLPSPTYKKDDLGFGYCETEVIFYPSTQHIQSSLPPRSLISYPRDTIEEATEAAACRAITYMKNEEKKVLKDYCYPDLEKQKRRNRALVRQKEAKERKARKNIERMYELTETFENYIAAVLDATQRIEKTLSSQQNHNVSLLQLHTVVSDISQQTVESRATLRTIGKYPPCEIQSSEEEPSTSWYESDDGTKSNYDCEIHDFDSDGRPTYYDV